MAKYVGANWATRGWFAVVFEDGGWETDLYPSILSLWKYHSDAVRLLVDVPIGLPASGKRRCDVLAKEKVGRHRRSVFYAPLRDAVYEKNLDVAKEINERAGFSIQNRTWGFVPRIREVDEFMDLYPGARDRLRETRSEVCFVALKGEELADSRSTKAGIEDRLEVVNAEDPVAGEIHRDAVETFMSPSFAPFISNERTILDAIAAAIAARREPDALATMPQSPPTDERGLRMEIVYPASTTQTQLSMVDGGPWR